MAEDMFGDWSAQKRWFDEAGKNTGNFFKDVFMASTASANPLGYTRYWQQRQNENAASGTSPGTSSSSINPDGIPATIPASPTTGPLLDPNRNRDPYEALLYGLLDQAGRGSGPNLSGYDSALADLETEKARVSDRYKKYSGQISDIYGTLTGITQSDIANIAPAGERTRSTLSAQEAERAAATRAADEARLATATEARAALGLEDIAGQYAGGDIATEQAEGMVADSAAQASAAENTLLANEAIAQQSGQNRIAGYGLQQEQSARQLQASLEDILAQIAAQQSQIKMERAQAAGSGSGPNIGAQLEILDRIQAYGNPQGLGEPTALEVWESRNPSLGITGREVADTFSEWISNTANYNAIPAVNLGRKPSAAEVAGAFLTQIRQNVPQAEGWARNASIYNLIVDLANTAE
jgi:hypothetical protein